MDDSFRQIWPTKSCYGVSTVMLFARIACGAEAGLNATSRGCSNESQRVARSYPRPFVRE